jgi:hypothetical protein
MNIVALGHAAGKIADYFTKYPNYQIIKIDVDIEDSKFSKCLKKQATMEDYEQKCPSLKTFFKVLKKDEVLFICVGSSPISGCALRILEQISDKKITILYIRPDLSLLSDKSVQQERVTFQVFQQYARSGLFEKMYIVNNTSIEEILGEIPITQYYDKINECIASTFHLINVYKHIKPVMENKLEIPEVARIGTIGIHNYETGTEKFFYPLQFKTNQIYYFAYNKEVLEKDGKIFQNIKKQLRERIGENTKVAFGIYSTDYKENYVFCEAHTHFIQEEKL